MLLKFIRIVPILIDILHERRVVCCLVAVLLRLLLVMILTGIIAPADSLIDQVILLVEE